MFDCCRSAGKADSVPECTLGGVPPPPEYMYEAAAAAAAVAAVPVAAAEDSEETAAAKRVPGAPRQGRALCPRCKRPPPVCLCASLPARPLANRVRLLVLLHPKEAKRAVVATAALLPLCLAHCDAVVGTALDEASLQLSPGRPPPLLLFPGEGAEELTESFCSGWRQHWPCEGQRKGSGGGGGGEVSEGGGGVAWAQTLVVLDGTWREAKQLYAANTQLFSKHCVKVRTGWSHRSVSAHCAP